MVPLEYVLRARHHRNTLRRTGTPNGRCERLTPGRRRQRPAERCRDHRSTLLHDNRQLPWAVAHPARIPGLRRRVRGCSVKPSFVGAATVHAGALGTPGIDCEKWDATTANPVFWRSPFLSWVTSFGARPSGRSEITVLPRPLIPRSQRVLTSGAGPTVTLALLIRTRVNQHMVSRHETDLVRFRKCRMS